MLRKKYTPEEIVAKARQVARELDMAEATTKNPHGRASRGRPSPRRRLIYPDPLKVIVQPYLEPYLGGDRFEAARIGGFDKRCGV